MANERVSGNGAWTGFGAGDSGRALAAYSWQNDPLGPPERWPASFRVTLANLLAAALPMALLWGPDFRLFYNDAYRPLLGSDGREPGAPGSPLKSVSPDSWHHIGPLLLRVRGGEAVHLEDLPTAMFRDGRFTETLWSYSYSPVRDDEGAIAGVLVVCNETTEKVLRSRNLLYQVNAALAILSGPNLVVEEANPAMLRLWGLGPGVLGRPLAEVRTGTTGQFLEQLHEVFRSGNTVRGFEVPISFHRPGGAVESFYCNYEYAPYKDAGGTVTGVMALAYDVTEQVKAKRAQAIAEDEVQSAIAAADLGYWHVDPRNNALRSNRRTRELFGLPPDEEHVQLDLAIAAIHPDDRQRVVDTIRRTLGDPDCADYDIEYRVLHPTGIRYVRALGKCYYDDEGSADRFSGTIQDITARMEAEQSLRASEQRFGAALEAVQGIVWTNSPDGRMTGEQPGWAALTGQSRAEYEGFGWANAVHPDDVQASIDAWKTAVRQKTKFEFEHRLRRADGEYRTYHIQAIPVLAPDGSIAEWVGVHTDITEQRRTEAALRHSEEQLRQLADFLPQIVWATDASGYHDFYNKRWYEFTGLTYEQTRRDGWAHLLHPDDVGRAQQAWDHCVSSGEPYEIEYRMRRADGEYRWLLARATPIQNEDGHIVRWFGTSTDIHDQKTSTETLERLVAERTRELQRSNEDLLQFAHVASHDLKEPVRKIATFESRLSHDFAEVLPERARAYLEKIRLSARRMYTMIEGVLRYSSLNEGENRQFEPVDLNEVLAQIRSDLEVLIEQQGARIEAGPLPVVPGLPTLLYQLFYNILNNALKFADKSRPLLIRISAEDCSPGLVCIRVQDNGIGFEPEQADRIFKTFTRLNSKDSYEGTGLGLALCQKIVDRHGGSIRAEGKKGEGATFFITLPKRKGS